MSACVRCSAVSLFTCCLEEEFWLPWKGKGNLVLCLLTAATWQIDHLLICFKALYSKDLDTSRVPLRFCSMYFGAAQLCCSQQLLFPPCPIWSWWRNRVVDFCVSSVGLFSRCSLLSGTWCTARWASGPFTNRAWSKAPWKQWRDWWGFA